MTGTFTESAPVHPESTCRVTSSFDHRDGTLRPFDVSQHLTFTVIGRQPALGVAAQNEAVIVERYGDFSVALSVHNAAYQADGTPLANGSRGPATNVTLYYRIPRDGDYPEVLENGIARADFLRTSSPDALATWVHTGETPLKGAANITAGNGWKLCAGAGLPCTSSELALAGVSDPHLVRWVVFMMGEVRVTDADGRGVTPRPPAVARVNAPYLATVELVDDGSDDGAILRSFVELLSPDSASPASVDSAGVEVDGECDARIPGVGFDQPEICDGLDNDCDGAIDEEDVCFGELSVLVFFDTAADGDASGDSGLAGWTVTVSNAGGLLISGLTDLSGGFSAQLPAGPVSVVLTDPGGFPISLSWQSTTGTRSKSSTVVATGTSTLQFGERCMCDDGDVCTADACTAPGVCSATAVPDSPVTACYDALFCNGSEACLGGTCTSVPGSAPCPAAEPDQCATISCDEETDQCASAPTQDTTCAAGGWAFYVAVRRPNGEDGAIKCTVPAGSTSAQCDTTHILQASCE